MTKASVIFIHQATTELRTVATPPLVHPVIEFSAIETAAGSLVLPPMSISFFKYFLSEQLTPEPRPVAMSSDITLQSSTIDDTEPRMTSETPILQSTTDGSDAKSTQIVEESLADAPTIAVDEAAEEVGFRFVKIMFWILV